MINLYICYISESTHTHTDTETALVHLSLIEFTGIDNRWQAFSETDWQYYIIQPYHFISNSDIYHLYIMSNFVNAKLEVLYFIEHKKRGLYCFF